MDCTGYQMDVADKRVCLTCKVLKPASEFNLAKNEKYKRIRLQSCCRACDHARYVARCERDPEGMRERQKASHDRRRERLRQSGELYETDRRRWMRANYHLTPEAYAAILESQGGRCAICRTSTPGGKRSWHIDHDHECCPTAKTCGKCIRGILCSHCNTRLAWFEKRGEAAAAYLERHTSGAV